MAMDMSLKYAYADSPLHQSIGVDAVDLLVEGLDEHNHEGVSVKEDLTAQQILQGTIDKWLKPKIKVDARSVDDPTIVKERLFKKIIDANSRNVEPARDMLADEKDMAATSPFTMRGEEEPLSVCYADYPSLRRQSGLWNNRG